MGGSEDDAFFMVIRNQCCMGLTELLFRLYRIRIVSICSSERGLQIDQLQLRELSTCQSEEQGHHVDQGFHVHHSAHFATNNYN